MPEWSLGHPHQSAAYLGFIIHENSEVIPEEFNALYEENYGGALNYANLVTPTSNVVLNPTLGRIALTAGRSIIQVVPRLIVTRSQSTGQVRLRVLRSGFQVFNRAYPANFQVETMIGSAFTCLANDGDYFEFLLSTPDRTYLTVVDGSHLILYKHFASGPPPVYA